MTVKSKIIDYAVAIVFGLVILIVTNNLWLGIIMLVRLSFEVIKAGLSKSLYRS